MNFHMALLFPAELWWGGSICFTSVPLLFPPVFQSLEKLAADFQIPPAPVRWESAALWFK